MIIAKICGKAHRIQNEIIDFINQNNSDGIGCISRDITTDGHMILFYDKRTWQLFVDFFDVLGFDFTTGEADDESPTWYIDLEFSDGITL